MLLPRVGEIAAAILEVGVEEEPVEIVADVVMMGDVLPRPLAPVELAEPMAELAALLEEFVRAGAVLPLVAAADDVDEVEDVALLDHQPPVPVGLGGAEARIAHDVADDPARP